MGNLVSKLKPSSKNKYNVQEDSQKDEQVTQPYGRLPEADELDGSRSRADPARPETARFNPRKYDTTVENMLRGQIDVDDDDDEDNADDKRNLKSENVVHKDKKND